MENKQEFVIMPNLRVQSYTIIRKSSYQLVEMATEKDFLFISNKKYKTIWEDIIEYNSHLVNFNKNYNEPNISTNLNEIPDLCS